MLTHNFFIAPSRHVFINSDCIACRCDEAIARQDHEKLGLRTIVVATLAVEGLAIYWQRLYFADEPVPMSAFLYLAWVEYQNLGGLPDRLVVQPELIGNVKKALRQLDPGKNIRHLEAGTGRMYSPTKKQTQVLSKHCIDPKDKLFVSSPPLTTQKECLARMNELLETYHRKSQDIPKPSLLHSTELKNRFIDQIHRNIILPAWPNTLVELLPKDIVNHDAHITRTDRISTNENFGWCITIKKQSIEESYRPTSYLASRFYGSSTYPPSYNCWIAEVPWLKAIANSVPFSLDEFFGSEIDIDQLQDFLCNRTSLPVIDTKRLYEKAVSRDRQGLVLFPNSVSEFADLINILGRSGRERCSAELLPRNNEFSFRIFAIDDNISLHILAVSKTSSIYSNSLQDLLYNSLGAIVIGDPGFAALNFWLEQMIYNRPRSHSWIFLDMLREMLKTIPLWAKVS